jgi:hypothetical protein
MAEDCNARPDSRMQKCRMLGRWFYTRNVSRLMFGGLGMLQNCSSPWFLQAVLAWGKVGMVLAFRGTQSMVDACIDLKVPCNPPNLPWEYQPFAWKLSNNWKTAVKVKV